MEKTRISYEDTRQLGNQLKNKANEYQQIYAQDIYSTFKTNLKECFQGDDADAAITQLDGLRDDFDAMTEVITEYGNKLIKAADNYEEDMIASKLSASKLTANRG